VSPWQSLANAWDGYPVTPSSAAEVAAARALEICIGNTAARAISGSRHYKCGAIYRSSEYKAMYAWWHRLVGQLVCDWLGVLSKEH